MYQLDYKFLIRKFPYAIIKEIFKKTKNGLCFFKAAHQ